MFYELHNPTGEPAKTSSSRYSGRRMTRLIRFGQSKRCHVLIHDGISDQVRACREVVEAGRYAPFRNDILQDSSWTGREFANWNALVAGVEQWKEGIEIIEKMVDKLRSVELPMPVVVKRRQTWRDDDGDFNLDRCLLGQNCWRNTVHGPSGGPQIVTMLVQINASASVSWRDMMWRGAACIAMATILEEAGYSTEIQAFSYSLEAYTNGDNLLQSTWVKRAGDPLDVSALVNATASWFRRTVGFVGYNLAYDHCPGLETESGYGMQAAAPDEILSYMAADLRTAWKVVEVWDEKSAVRLAKEYLASLSGQPVKEDDADVEEEEIDA